MKLVKRIVDGVEKEFFELTEEEIVEMKKRSKTKEESKETK